MSWLIVLQLIGALLAGYCVALVAQLFMPPAPKLANRVLPYTAASRSRLGKSSDYKYSNHFRQPQNPIERLVRSAIHEIAIDLHKIIKRYSKQDSLALKLQHANVLADIPDKNRIHQYRLHQIGSALTTALLVGSSAFLLEATPLQCVTAFILGAIFGVLCINAVIKLRVRKRRRQMKAELPSIVQLLGAYLYMSGSPIWAVQRIVRRGHGIIIDELAEALRLHSSGMPTTDAFEYLARKTSEPRAAHVYKVLARETGRAEDLATALQDPNRYKR